jgi:hypothetical protein
VPDPLAALHSPELMEILAALEHDRWSRWQRYLHSRCETGEDGTLTIPADLVARWEDQSSRPYDALTEAEKESDREQVRQYLPAIAAAIAGSLR